MRISYAVFCFINVLWLVAFASFSFLNSFGASFMIASGFFWLYVLSIFLFAVFAVQNEDKTEFIKWFYVAVIVMIGLTLRIIARQIFQTAQMQDFGRAHDALLHLEAYGPLMPSYSWAELNWYQLYYSRFPGWFPFFAVTRAVYNVFGVGVRYMIFLNYILYILSAGVLFAAVKRIFSFSVAFCSIVFFVFNPNLVLWAAITSPDPYFMFLFFCILYFYSKDSLKSVCAVAVLAALSDFFKPIGLMFLIAYFCVEFFVKILNKSESFSLVLKNNYRKWVAFLFIFFAVYGIGHAIVRAEIRRVFHVETVSSTGMYMAFAWSTDDAGNFTLDPVFDKFDRLMYEHENNQVIVMEEMSRYAREMFADSRNSLPSILWQKARMTFGDEGVLGWVFYSYDAQRSAEVNRVLGNVLWIGFTAHVFFIMIFAAVGVLLSKAFRGRVLIFLLTTMVGYTLVLLLGVVQARYRILLYPQLSILAAVGVVGLVKMFSWDRIYNFLKYHGREIVLPVDEMKSEIPWALVRAKSIVDFGAGTLFWSEYFANRGLEVFAVDTLYEKFLPQNDNPRISLHKDISSILNGMEAESPHNRAIFICDVIHHLPTELWQEILPKISAMFDVIIIKDIDANRKFGNFCSTMHDRVINAANFENVYPNEIESFLKNAGFDVQIKSLPKLWYPHFLLIATKN